MGSEMCIRDRLLIREGGDEQQRLLRDQRLLLSGWVVRDAVRAHRARARIQRRAGRRLGAGDGTIVQHDMDIVHGLLSLGTLIMVAANGNVRRLQTCELLRPT